MSLFMYCKHLLCSLWLRLKVHCFFTRQKDQLSNFKITGRCSRKAAIVGQESGILSGWRNAGPGSFGTETEKTYNLQEGNFTRYHQPVYSRIQDSMLAPEINPELSKLILMNFPCREKINKWLKAELIDLFSLRAQKRSHPVVWGK